MTDATPTETPVRRRTLQEVTALEWTAPGHARAEISADWTVAGKPNGGYLTAMLAGAVPRPPELPDVVAASVHFLRSTAPGPAEMRTELLHAGRSVAHARATLTQDGRTCTEALFTLGRLGDASTDPAWDRGAPAVSTSGFEQGERLRPDPTVFPVALFDQVDARLDPEHAQVLRGQPSGRGELRGWLALPGDEPFTPTSLLFAVDAFPPATIDIEFSGWVPTLQLSAYVRARPAPGPVRVLQRAQLLHGYRLDETCTVWDRTGRLVAQATQLAAVSPTARPAPTIP